MRHNCLSVDDGSHEEIVERTIPSAALQLNYLRAALEFEGNFKRNSWNSNKKMEFESKCFVLHVLILRNVLL